MLEVARTETSPELKREAIHMIGVSGGREELWQLYQQETSVDAKDAIINALFVGGGADRLAELAQKESDPRLRREAIQKLGLTGASKSAAVLKKMYGTEKDPEIKRTILNAFFIQGNAATLVEIARAETDAGLKREAVQKLVADALQGSHRLHAGAAEMTPRTIVAVSLCSVFVPLISALPPALPGNDSMAVLEAGPAPAQTASPDVPVRSTRIERRDAAQGWRRSIPSISAPSPARCGSRGPCPPSRRARTAAIAGVTARSAGASSKTTARFATRVASLAARGGSSYSFAARAPA